MSKFNIKTIKIEDFLYNLPGHVYLKDRDGRYLGCNALQAKDLGLNSQEEIIGKTDFDLSQRNEAKILRENDIFIMKSGIAQTLEEKKFHKDGSITIYLSQKVPLYDENGDAIGLLGISFDITERKKREEQYIHDRDYIELTLDSILSNLPEHVYWIDVNNIFLGCNKKQAETFGLDSPNKIKGKTVYDFESQEDADLIVNVNNKIMATGRPLSVEEPFLTPEGEQKVFLSKKVPLTDLKKNIIGVLGISFDITAEKEAEKLRSEKKAAEERAETIKLFSASMAHELRTPLRAIESGAIGVSECLPRLIEAYEIAKTANIDVPYISPVHYQSLGKVFHNLQVETEAAFSVLDMLLVKSDLSRINATEFKTCSMERCVELALTRYPFRPGEADLVRCQKGDFLFYGDEILMIHIIFNLLKNALHYVKAAAKGDIQISMGQNDKFNILYFKDTGQGIAPDILPHIFERFFTRTTHGTGVGLAFCQLVMQSFGGDICCDSVKDEYTEFALYFPVKTD